VSYRGTNAKRLELLFGSGMEPRELSDMLRATKTKLLAAGAKLHKVSSKFDDRVRFLARIDGKPADVVADWIRKNIEADESLAPEALVAQFEVLERSGGKLKREQASVFARTGLRYLFSDTPPEAWITFLATPIGKARADADLRKGGAAQPDEQTEGSRDAIDAETVEDLAEVLETTATRSPEASRPRTAAGVALRILSELYREPKSDVAEVVLPDEAGVLGDGVIELIAKRAASWRSRVPQRGLRRQVPRDVSELGQIDGDGAEIVGVCTGQTPAGTAVFVEPLAIVVGSDLWALNGSAAQKIFYETGQVIGFPGTRGLKLPEVEEIGIWTVKHYGTPQSIKFRLQKPGRAFYSVMDIPFSSGEPDHVRIAISRTDLPKGGRSLFHLADDSVVKPKGDVSQHSAHAFDEPLDAWKTIEAWEVARRKIVLAPLPPPDHLVDCSDLTAVLRRLISQADVAAKLPQMSQAQTRAFLESLESTSTGLTRARLDRLRAELERFVEDRNGLEGVLELLLANTRVKDELARVKQKVVDDFEKSRTDLIGKKTQLEQEIRRLAAKRKELQDQESETASKMSQAVKKAFERAKATGLETLAESAVFGAILNARDTQAAQQHVSDRLSAALVEPIADDRGQCLRELGFRAADAQGIHAFAVSALAHGLAVGLVGSGSNLAATALGRSIASRKCAIVDVGVGVLTGGSLRECLGVAEKDADVIVLRSVNCSDFYAYGADAEWRIVERLNRPERGPRFVLGFADGPSSLPVAQVLEDLCLLIDLSVVASSVDRDAASVDELLDEADSSGRRPFQRLRNRVLRQVVAQIRGGDVDEALLARIAEANLRNA